MRKSPPTLAILSILLIIPFLPLFTEVTDYYRTDPINTVQKESVAYIEHIPIDIDSDADFGSQGWPGNGTIDNPYIIQGLNITDSGYCIDISNTTAYFEIRDCLLTWTGSDAGIGVYLSDVVNCLITTCNISQKSYGIYTHESYNISIYDNWIEDNNVALRTWYCEYISIEMNNVTMNRGGVTLEDSTNITVSNNILELQTSYGIQIETSHYNHITNNSLVSNHANALELFSSSFNTIRNNTFQSSSIRAIYLSSSASNIFINNTISQVDDIGIEINESGNQTIANNQFFGCGIWMVGYELHFWQHNITKNHVNGKDLLYLWNSSADVIDGEYCGQILVVNCSDVSIENGTFESATVPVQLVYSLFCDIENVTARYGIRGAYLHSSRNVTLTDCSFTNNDESGLHLYYNSDNNTIANSTMSDNLDFGIFMNSSDNNTILNITIENCDVGLRVSVSSQNDYINNTIKGNSRGVSVSFSIDDLFFNNSIINNHEFGIYSIFSNNNTYVNNSISYNQEFGTYMYTTAYDHYINNTFENNGHAGVNLDITKWNTFQSNIFTNCGFLIDSDDIIEWNQTLIDNTVNGEPIGYLWNASEIVIDAETFGQFIIAYCRNATLINGDFNNASYGLLIGHSEDCLVDQVASYNNRVGTRIAHSQNVTIRDSLFLENSEYGISLDNTSQCLIGNNTVTKNDNVGINIESSSTTNTLWGNILYENTINAEDDGSNNSWDNGIDTGNAWGDYSGTGTYTIPGTANSIDHYPTLPPDTLPPSINSPNDIVYSEGTNGHVIHWIPQDSNPAWFEVYRNGTRIDSGVWNGSDIILDIDELDLGIYNFTIIVSDEAGSNSSDTVFVSVIDTTPPIVDEPDDISYIAGTTGHSIIWQTDEVHPSHYEIYLDGTVITMGNWSTMDIEVGVDGLEVGLHNFTLVVYDTTGNSANDIVIVHVIGNNAPSTTTTSTTGQNLPEDGLLDLSVIIILVGLISLIAIIVFLLKYR